VIFGLDRGLVLRHLAVQHAQRVRLDAPLAVAAERRCDRSQRLLQRRDVGRPAALVADGVQHQLAARHAARVEEGERKLDHLGVDRRAREAEGLDVDLVELPVAALLRPLAPEHRPDRVDAERRVGVHQVVLDHRAHDAGRGLGPEGQRAAVAVVEGVHLLRDDVGVGADAAREELGLLEDGRSQLAIAVAREELARRRLDAVPGRNLLRQHVLRAADRLDRHSPASARYSSLYRTYRSA
jgi:hypothetical protein